MLTRSQLRVGDGTLIWGEHGENLMAGLGVRTVGSTVQSVGQAFRTTGRTTARLSAAWLVDVM